MVRGRRSNPRHHVGDPLMVDVGGHRINEMVEGNSGGSTARTVRRAGQVMAEVDYRCGRDYLNGASRAVSSNLAL
jgi:hypothetical protein